MPVTDKGDVIGDDISPLVDLFHAHEASGPLGGRPGRIAKEGLTPQRLHSPVDGRPDMAHADDAHTAAVKADITRLSQPEERRGHILPYGTGIAARAVGPRYAGLSKIVSVNVVIADCGRSHETHPAPFEQGAVTARPRADNEHVGIGHVGLADGSAGQVAHRTHTLGLALQIGNFVVRYNTERTTVGFHPGRHAISVLPSADCAGHGHR